jgi:hypothetical protein
MDLARATARATAASAAFVVDPASHGTMTASGMGGGRTATDPLLPRGTILSPTEEDRVDAHDGDNEAARMRRRMRDDNDTLRSSASAMLRELRMQEERDGDDDYYHDRRCAPDDASHSPPPPVVVVVGAASASRVQCRQRRGRRRGIRPNAQSGEHDRGEHARADPAAVASAGGAAAAAAAAAPSSSSASAGAASASASASAATGEWTCIHQRGRALLSGRRIVRRRSYGGLDGGRASWGRVYWLQMIWRGQESSGILRNPQKSGVNTGIPVNQEFLRKIPLK